MSKKFSKILKAVAQKEGIPLSHVTCQMQEALDEAWEKQTATMQSTFMKKPTIEEFFWRTCMETVC